ncbi:MAG: sugar phosphate isomerase/epimerase [Deltaproteobacteria bacterium]|nr:sugar phosphate isomerase/epimerase [Deltaproteobacteria bacterium]
MNTEAHGKNGFPFRLGCTSYVYPEDLLPNVRKMAPMVDDIEIVLFETESLSNLPSTAVISELAQIQAEHGNTYTIHFPIDKKAASPEKQERKYFQEQALKIIHLTLPLHPFAYILHLEGIDENADTAEQETWKSRSMETCREISNFSGVDNSTIAVENLGYPVEWNEEIVEHFDFSFCMDIGHLWLYQYDWEEALQKHLDDTRVIHLHGVSDGNDHLSIEKNDQMALKKLVTEYLPAFHNVVTLEVFSKEATFGSIRRLKTLWEK